jgi:hypothetical protein
MVELKRREIAAVTTTLAPLAMVSNQRQFANSSALLLAEVGLVSIVSKLVFAPSGTEPGLPAGKLTLTLNTISHNSIFPPSILSYLC